MRGASTIEPFTLPNYSVNPSFVSEKRAQKLHHNQQKSFFDQSNHFYNVWDPTHVWFRGEDELYHHYGQEWAYPLADKRVIEFLWASPPEIFFYQGWTRGYIRRAMLGTLPEEILWRKDKGAFTPDFQKRIIDEKPELTRYLESAMGRKYAHYLNIEHIIDSLQKLQPGRKDQVLEAIMIVHRGIQALKYLHWINSDR